MREVPEDERAERARMMREQGRRYAEALVPRPGHPIYGLAAPSLRPAVATHFLLSNGVWTTITLTYGAGDAQAGPHVAVTTTATDADTMARAGSEPVREDDLEAELRSAVENELDQASRSVGAGETERSDPLALTRETLSGGPALVCRGGSVWAARLLPAGPPTDNVVVTIVGLGVDPESVRLEPVVDLRPIIEARFERFAALTERGPEKPRPRLSEPEGELEPAEGVAALLALAEFTLTSNADRRSRLQAGQRRWHDPDWGTMRNALWRRAVREHQRLRGSDRPTADDAVTVAVNHLGFLQEKARWFTADPRLRTAAIDETLRHAMLGEAVPSEPAQDAWARYWSTHVTRLGRDREPIDPLAAMSARAALTGNCLRAWAAWAETA